MIKEVDPLHSEFSVETEASKVQMVILSPRSCQGAVMSSAVMSSAVMSLQHLDVVFSETFQESRHLSALTVYFLIRDDKSVNSWLKRLSSPFFPQTLILSDAPLNANMFKLQELKRFLQI